MSQGPDYTRRQVMLWALSLRAPTYQVRLVPAGNRYEAPGAPLRRSIISQRYDYEQLVIRRRADDGSVRDTIRFLRGRSADDYHVYARPDALHHLLIDDLDMDGLAAMKADGLVPNAVVWTSEGSWQAWLKLSEDGELPPDVIAVASRLAAERYEGDTHAVGAERFGRLPGFTNRKQEHQSRDGRFPFTQLLTGSRGGVTAAAYRLVEEARSLVASRTFSSSTLGPVHSGTDTDIFHADPRRPRMSTEEANAIYEQTRSELADMRKIATSQDRSSVDFEIARRLHLTGFEQIDAADVVNLASPKAKERSPEQAALYARRTVLAAFRGWQ